MAKKSRRQRVITPLLDKWSEEIEAAFIASVDLIRSEVEFNRLVERISAGDLGGALAALHIDSAAFTQFRDKLAQSYASGGAAGVKSMPKRYPDGTKFVIRFDGAQPEASRWIAQYSSNMVAEIVDDQRFMVRQALSENLSLGKNPRTAALDLVGRYDKKLGKRTGGLIGLTRNQAEIIANAAEELTGNRAALSSYLERKLRDKRYDRYVIKAMEGEPIPADIQQKMVSRMKDNFLKLRGDTIGRTEALTTLHQGKYQSFAQAIASGDVTVDEIEREWLTASDSRVRHSHQEMNHQIVGFNEYYTTPSGAKLLFPGDPNGPASEIINCRCDEHIRINFLKRLR